MIPTTYESTLILTILSMLCWGSWANSTKLAKGYRFELFYFDYSIAVFLAATVAAFTFGMMDAGTMDSETLSLNFVDNLALTYKMKIAYAVAGGAIFNLANMLLVAAIGVAGMAVAFPIGIGLALVGGVVGSYVIHPAGSAPMLFGGVGLVLAAIVVSALAHAKHHAAPAGPRRVTIQHQHQQQRALHAEAHVESPSVAKGILLSVAAGVLMAAFYPLVQLGMRGDLALGPYAATFCFACGVLITTPIYNVFFMRLPVEGGELHMKDYFRAKPWHHLLGLLGGLVWAVGTISNFVASSAPKSVNVGPATSYALS
jgi:glucose uptake protein